jgi:hypothetical protein
MKHITQMLNPAPFGGGFGDATGDALRARLDISNSDEPSLKHTEISSFGGKYYRVSPSFIEFQK